MWKPTTVAEATVAMELSIALRDIAGRHLVPSETYALIDSVQARDEPSPSLRLHAVILAYFSLDAVRNHDRIASVVADFQHLLAADRLLAEQRRKCLMNMMSESERLGLYDLPEAAMSEVRI